MSTTLEHIEKLIAATSAEELLELGSAYAEKLGFNGFLYGQQGRSEFGYKPPLIISDYSREWMNEYMARNAITIDPLVRHMMKHITPLTWDAATELHADREGVMLMKDASDFNMRSGVFVPVRGNFQQRGLISMHSDIRPKEMQSYFNSYQGDITLYALHYHEALTRIMRNSVPPIKLTRREREVLQAAADGKDTSCIATLLGISEATALAHFTSAFRKLGAENRVHAIAIALQKNLITL
jgi:DNA-binding CsgD family transcriptional regulator